MAGRRLVMRSDNKPTVTCINKRGSTKPTMAAARRAVDAACEAYDIEVLLLHIPGRRNAIADALSRGDIATARELHDGAATPADRAPRDGQAGAAAAAPRSRLAIYTM